MGQKVNPIAVRLQVNRLSDSNWFSDYYYSTFFYHDVNLRKYFSLVKQPSSNKLGFRVGKCVIHHFPKRSFIHLFCLSEQRSEESNTSRNWKFRTIQFRNALVGTPQILSPVDSWKESKIKEVVKKIEYSSEVDANESLDAIHYRRSFVFWSSQASTLQKKKALIHLFRGVVNGLTRLYFGDATEQKYNTIFQKINKRNQKFNTHYQFGNLTFPQSLFLENKELFKGQSRSNMTNCYLNSYAMHYFFLKKGNVFSFNRIPATTELGKVAQKNTEITSKEMSQSSSKIELYSRVKKQMNNIVGIGVGGKNNFLEVSGDSNWLPPLTKRVERQNLLPISTNTEFAGINTNSEFLTKSLDFSLSTIHHVLSLTTSTSVSIRPIKVNSIFYSASLVAQEVACKLEQKKSFRLICRLIFQQLISFRHIKGIRITCSGRINGAEIAKTECRKFGETSLHVFSDKIDFARAEASTSYGLLGVKVWISFL